MGNRLFRSLQIEYIITWKGYNTLRFSTSLVLFALFALVNNRILSTLFMHMQNWSLFFLQISASEQSVITDDSDCR